jgi:hypothetical protein
MAIEVDACTRTTATKPLGDSGKAIIVPTLTPSTIQ